VGQDRLAGPDPGSFGAIQAGAIPAVAAFEAADPTLAAGYMSRREASINDLRIDENDRRIRGPRTAAERDEPLPLR
jgi:hypothetical protein